MKIGDIIQMEEPPVGAVLRVHDPIGEYRIWRTEQGWVQPGNTGRPISWRSVISAWGPGSDSAIWFEVVELP